jgi:phosphoribosylaminoimidazolecarboxamide formyltransferase/IMP cyclohydrolase
MRALLSVYDKDGIVDLASGLVDLGYEIVSTGGTLRTITGAGIPVRSVSEVTGFPEILDGRVKTLHPAIHAGILARRDDPAHVRTLTNHQIEAIDLVAVNLYPFAATIAQPNVSLSEAVEQIDIGGPAMLRAAAKSFADVVILTDPSDYQPTLAALIDGPLGPARRRALAAKAFAHVAAYDAVVATYLAADDESTSLPPRLSIVGEKVADLRYGENPHQTSAFYRETTHRSPTLADATILQGGMPSFNNLLDLDVAYRLASDYTTPTVVIAKHTDPVGIASADELVEAYRRALETDPVASFGAIVGVNRQLDGATAREIAANSYEAVIAPGFDDSAIGILRQKSSLELVHVPPGPTEGMRDYGIARLDFKRIGGGLLVETVDDLGLDGSQLQVVTKRRPTLEELTDLLFAWRAVRHVRSNAIVLAKNAATVGIGSGQPSRQVSVEIALRRAGERARLSVMAADAYFPFPDGIQVAAQAGVTAIIQPGGSIRDEMAIEVADRHHLAMVFTGRRHFRH